MAPVAFVAFMFIISIQSGNCYHINVASLANGAQCTSDGILTQDTPCDKAIDGREDPVNSEWVSLRGDVGSFMNVSFNAQSQVDEIKFLQRCRTIDRLNEVNVFFGDGSSKLLTLSCDGGGASATDCDGFTWERFRFVPISTNYVNITIAKTCDTEGFVGLREVVVLADTSGDHGITSLATEFQGGTCESSSDFNDQYTCQNALDAEISPNQQSSWASAEGDSTGSWLKITLPGRSQVSKVRFMNRCLLDEQMRTAQVDFGSGFIQNVTLSCYDGASAVDCVGQDWVELSPPNVMISSIIITGLETCDPAPRFAGFQEVEILGKGEQDQACPFDFTEVVRKTSTSCYKFVHQVADRMSITEAKAACLEMNPSGHLVEINSYNEQDYLSRTSETLRIDGVTCDQYYTNGYRLTNTSDTWFWESTGQQIVMPYWAPLDTGTSAGRFISMTQVLGAGPLDQWKWTVTEGFDTGCYICEI